VVFGYSQSATIAAFEKYDLIAHPATGKTVSFVVISNPNRPNGGILERFVGVYIPILGVTFSGAMTTNSPDVTGYTLTTVDVAHQYDPVSDFPTNPLNLLSESQWPAGLLLFPSRAVVLRGGFRCAAGPVPGHDLLPRAGQDGAVAHAAEKHSAHRPADRRRTRPATARPDRDRL
jgi:PE-PPE domain